MVKAARALVYGALFVVAAVAGAAGLDRSAGAVAGAANGAADRPVLVFAGASLKNALDAAAASFTSETGTAVTASYAATSALAKQIEAGAPADVFIAADPDWMDYLGQRGLIRTETRRNLLGNGLVLIAPKTASVNLKIAPGFPLAAALADGRLAMANTVAVPAGKYARAALESLDVWPEVEPRIVQAGNVREALALVSRGEAILGIVYRTDAAADPNVVVVDTFPDETHPPIIYSVAVVAGSAHPDAAAFAGHLANNGDARGAFKAEGFDMLPAGAGY